jgi:hypothetical protein
VSLTPEQERLNADKHEIVMTTNTRGWHLIVKMAEGVVRDAENATMAEEDETKIVRLQRKAQSKREFLAELLKRVEEMKQIDVSEDHSDFIAVAID